MKDGEIKKTGNSRFMRSLNMPDTYEGFKALLESGIFPFDLNGINPDGWKTIPDWLNKLNLLSDGTCNSLGISTNSVPDNALSKLNTLVNTAQLSADSKAKIETGFYWGTGAGGNGSGTPNVIHFNKLPKMLLITSDEDIISSGKTYSGIAMLVSVRALSSSYRKSKTDTSNYIYLKAVGNSVYWYTTYSAKFQFNASGIKYTYVAIG